VRIRAGDARDAEDIGRVVVETWRSAYRGLVPDAFLDDASPAERAGVWRNFLEKDSARFVLMADDDRNAAGGFTAVGFMVAGPERTGDPTHPGEVYAVYVLPSHQGRGLGRGLMRAAAARLAAGGIASMLLWVLEANTPARGFYEALGGAVVRTRSIEFGGTRLAEVAYGWSRLDALLEAVG
jgi:ribosomal protein S18 acetylase RimI-like enzyme